MSDYRDAKEHLKWLSHKADDEDEDDDEDEEEGSLLSKEDEDEVKRVASDILELALEAESAGGVIGSVDDRKHAVEKKLRQLVARTKGRSRVGDRVDEDRRYARAKAALGGKEK